MAPTLLPRVASPTRLDWVGDAGVSLDGGGYLKVNDRLETTAPSVWGIGECAGSPQFTHASFDDFRIIRDNLAGGESKFERPADAVLPVH